MIQYDYVEVMRDVHHGDASSVSSDGHEKGSPSANGDKRLDESWGPLRGNPPPPKNFVTVPAGPADPAGNFV